MDAVFFSMKRAHLGGQRLGRLLLEPLGLTPARFDLINTIDDCEEPMTQTELWRRLGVVRSAVCEMVKALVALGIIERTRAPDDSRTWIVKLTTAGRALQKLAYDALINNGEATQLTDNLITVHDSEDPATRRYEWTSMFFAIGARLGNRVVRNSDLYMWDIEDLYACLIRPEDGETWGSVPWMDEKFIAENMVDIDVDVA